MEQIAIIVGAIASLGGYWVISLGDDESGRIEAALIVALCGIISMAVGVYFLDIRS